MSELMVLLQALLLIAGWLLFLRAQTELRAQAARQSLTGELEELRQTVDALLQKLAEEAAQAEARLEARLKELEQRSTDIPVRATPPACSTDIPVRAQLHNQRTDRNVRATHPMEQHSPSDESLDRNVQAIAHETFASDSGYNLSASETSLHGAIAVLAEQGLSVPEIARQTGYAQGEVELILNLTRRSTEENG